MTKYTAFLIAFLFSLPLVSSASNHVSLKYPRGGEAFTSGTTVIIEWQQDILHDTQNWDVYFSFDSGISWQQIRIDIPAPQRTHLWVVPDIPTSQGRIKVIQDNTRTDYEDWSAEFSIIAIATSIDDSSDSPESAKFLSSFPNPFNSETALEFELAFPEHVRLEIFDALGRSVSVLIDGKLPRGSHRITWYTAGWANGFYVSRIVAGDLLESKILLLVR